MVNSFSYPGSERVINECCVIMNHLITSWTTNGINLTNDKRISEEKNSHNSSLMVILEIIIYNYSSYYTTLHHAQNSSFTTTNNCYYFSHQTLHSQLCQKKIHYADYFFHNLRMICPTSRGFLEWYFVVSLFKSPQMYFLFAFVGSSRGLLWF